MIKHGKPSKQMQSQYSALDRIGGIKNKALRKRMSTTQHRTLKRVKYSEKHPNAQYGFED